jgi:uncharacterized protein (TIGR02596 family)
VKRPFPSRISQGRHGTGFTLVELLVVLAIIAIIVAASVTAFSGVNSALNLSTASQTIMSEITTARQTALTYSETVEVRFYYYMDPITNTNQYQAIQTFTTRDGVNFTQLDKISYLPVNIMIDKSTTKPLSYPLSEADTTLNPQYTPNQNVTINGVSTPTTGAPPTLSGGQAYTYKFLRFKIDGGIDYAAGTTPWPPATWYITLYEKKYATAATAAIKNFVTVNVDSINGRIRMFQP